MLHPQHMTLLIDNQVNIKNHNHHFIPISLNKANQMVDVDSCFTILSWSQGWQVITSLLKYYLYQMAIAKTIPSVAKALLAWCAAVFNTTSFLGTTLSCRAINEAACVTPVFVSAPVHKCTGSLTERRQCHLCHNQCQLLCRPLGIHIQSKEEVWMPWQELQYPSICILGEKRRVFINICLLWVSAYVRTDQNKKMHYHRSLAVVFPANAKNVVTTWWYNHRCMPLPMSKSCSYPSRAIITTATVKTMTTNGQCNDAAAAGTKIMDTTQRSYHCWHRQHCKCSQSIIAAVTTITLTMAWQSNHQVCHWCLCWRHSLLMQSLLPPMP